MIATDKNAFKQMMVLLHEVYRKQEPSRELLGLWWQKLEKFELDIVSHAFNWWSDNQSAMATPHDILALCKSEVERRELIKVTIAPRKNSLLTYQNNKSHARELKQVANKLASNDGKDHRVWAKRIMKRINDGERGIPDIAVRFASEAIAWSGNAQRVAERTQ